MDKLDASRLPSLETFFLLRIILFLISITLHTIYPLLYQH